LMAMTVPCGSERAIASEVASQTARKRSSLSRSADSIACRSAAAAGWLASTRSMVVSDSLVLISHSSAESKVRRGGRPHTPMVDERARWWQQCARDANQDSGQQCYRRRLYDAPNRQRRTSRSRRLHCPGLHNFRARLTRVSAKDHHVQSTGSREEGSLAR
jgi:hypothetical protein